VSVDIANTCLVVGTEVPQLYLSYPESAGEPPKVLRAFDCIKVDLGQTKTVVFTLSPQDFSIWDVSVHDWAVVRGNFTILIGSSSRDIRVKQSLVY